MLRRSPAMFALGCVAAKSKASSEPSGSGEQQQVGEPEPAEIVLLAAAAGGVPVSLAEELAGPSPASDTPEAAKPAGVYGNTKEYINWASIVVVAALLVFVVLAQAIARWFSADASAPGRPSAWVFAMLAFSYMLLVPGLHAILFSFAISVTLDGNKIDLASVLGKEGPITESMMSLVRMLFEDGAYMAGCLVLFYAVAVPAAKLVLLALGEGWRYSRPRAARQCIRVVQLISKWACPDMFAYVLVIYLFRNLDEKSSMIGGPAHLDIGFVCFSLFCICSTFSSLFIPLPEQKPEAVEARLPALMIKYCGVEGMAFAVSTLSIAMAAFLATGISTPCMGMRFDPDLLIEPIGPLPRNVKAIMEKLNLKQEVEANVSLLTCIKSLVRWLSRGELTCVFAVVLLLVFVLALTALSVASLVRTTYDLHMAAAARHQREERLKAARSVQRITDLVDPVAKDPAAAGKDSASAATSSAEALRSESGALAAAHALRKISMLDVFIMGVVVICLAGNAYSDKGMKFVMQPGLLLLLCAEALHYVLYYLVSGAAEYLAAQEAQDAIGIRAC